MSRKRLHAVTALASSVALSSLLVAPALADEASLIEAGHVPTDAPEELAALEDDGNADHVAVADGAVDPGAAVQIDADPAQHADGGASLPSVPIAEDEGISGLLEVEHGGLETSLVDSGPVDEGGSSQTGAFLSDTGAFAPTVDLAVGGGASLDADGSVAEIPDTPVAMIEDADAVDIAANTDAEGPGADDGSLTEGPAATGDAVEDLLDGGAAVDPAAPETPDADGDSALGDRSAVDADPMADERAAVADMSTDGDAAVSEETTPEARPQVAPEADAEPADETGTVIDSEPLVQIAAGLEGLAVDAVPVTESPVCRTDEVSIGIAPASVKASIQPAYTAIETGSPVDGATVAAAQPGGAKGAVDLSNTPAPFERIVPSPVAPSPANTTVSAVSEAKATPVVPPSPASKAPSTTVSARASVETADASLRSKGSSKVEESRVGWQKIDGVWYFYGADGKVAKGKIYVDEKFYYLDDETGAMRTGWVDEEDGRHYYGKGGAMRTGWVLDEGTWYYLDVDSATVSTGWIKPKTAWYYLDESSGAMQTGWLDEGGSRYYLNESSGAMKTGWLHYGDDWYYLRNSGRMHVGWAKPASAWYYLQNDGTMATGDLELGAKRYYLNETSGAMKTGWLKIADPDTWRFYSDSGAMATGELQRGDKSYFLDWDSGLMARNQFIWLNDDRSSDGHKTVYYGDDGAMLFGKQTVDGTDYYLEEGTGALTKFGYQNPSGYWQLSGLNVTLPYPDARSPFNYATPSAIGYGATRDECVETFIDTAYDYLGTGYVWDYSCAPGVGVDCAGLVLQCMYSVGIDTGEDYNPYDHFYTPGHDHYANDMSGDSRFEWVSLSDRRRGDLVFWPGHVAIYLGNDSIIEAYPGSVYTSSIWSHGTPSTIRRVFI